MPDPLVSFDEMDSAVSRRNETDSTATMLPCEKQKPKERVRIVIRDEQFKVYPKVRYALTVDSEPFSGVTGEDGVIDHLVRPGSRQGDLTVWLTPESKPRSWDLTLDLEPVGVTKGLEARLENLGLEPGPVDDTLEKESKEALGRFVGFFPEDSDPSGDLIDDETSNATEPDERVEQLLEKVYRGRDEAAPSGRFIPGPYRPRDAFTPN